MWAEACTVEMEVISKARWWWLRLFLAVWLPLIEGKRLESAVAAVPRFGLVEFILVPVMKVLELSSTAILEFWEARSLLPIFLFLWVWFEKIRLLSSYSFVEKATAF